jgi:ribonuclease BN (tRNA processing enzyme)
VLKGAAALAWRRWRWDSGAAALRRSGRCAETRHKRLHTRLVLLGTTGGMTWWPGSNRASNSQVLVVGDAMYLVDLGWGSLARLAEGFNFGHFATVGGQRTQLELSSFMTNIRAVFLTHLHMDHLGDYPTFLEIGARAGYAEKQPLIIIGPGDRGRLEENRSGYTGTVIQAETCNPPLVTPTRARG